MIASKNKVIDKLALCNPPFNIIFFTYGKNHVRSKPVDSSANFDCYDTFINKMKLAMNKIYGNWDNLSVNERKKIINRKSRRLRFETVNIYYDDLLNVEQGIKNSDFSLYLKDECKSDTFNKNENLINEFNIVKLMKAEEEENEFKTKDYIINKDDIGRILSEKYNPSNITKINEERNSI